MTTKAKQQTNTKSKGIKKTRRANKIDKEYSKLDLVPQFYSKR
jgi:hypothetical protein